MPANKTVAILAAASAVALGCGSDSDTTTTTTSGASGRSSQTTSPAATQSGASDSAVDGQQLESCVRDAVGSAATVSASKDDVDVIAERAGDHAFVVQWPRNEANVAVERNDDDAKATAQQYAQFASVSGANSDDLVKRFANVVVAFSKTPADDELAAFENCVDAR